MKSGEKRAEDQFLLAAQERPSLVSGAGTNGSTSKGQAPDEKEHAARSPSGPLKGRARKDRRRTWHSTSQRDRLELAGHVS